MNNDSLPITKLLQSSVNLLIALVFYGATQGALAQYKSAYGVSRDYRLASLIEEQQDPDLPRVLPYKEPPKSNWALAFDNDIFALGHR